MSKVKLVIIGLVGLIIASLSASVIYLNKQYRNTQDSLKVAVNNNKAYEAENDSLKLEKIQFNFTIDQLKHSNDSIIQKLNKTVKQLKIKDKQIKELEYIASHNRRVDTLTLHDTLFRENVKLDTLIQDKWSSLWLELEYPNKIVADRSFNNEMSIIVKDKRETIKPPKKCWLGRLFQKKHTIVEVIVTQENPYCEIDKQKHIKVIK